MTDEPTISNYPTAAYPNIVLLGKMGSGKTTAKDLLVEHLDYNWIRFAGALRDTVESLWGEDERENRELLQGVGHGLRAVDPDVWVNKLFADLSPHVIPPPYVIDDCRYPNELHKVKGEGFTSIRIGAAQHLRIDRLKQNGRWNGEGALYHESETALDNYSADFTIENTGTVFDLWTELTQTIRIVCRAALPA